MSTHTDTMSENAEIETGSNADPKAQGDPSGESVLGATPCSALDEIARICFDPCPPMPEYLKAEYLAPAIARGGDKSDAWESWRSQNPDECEHKWEWHATGAGMGWCCDKCDGYHAFERDEDRPPATGCISLQNADSEAGIAYSDLFAGFDPDEYEMLTMDGYDDCIVGVVERYGQNPIVCYDKEKVIQCLESDGMDRGEAEEFFDFNQIGAWMGESTPCFLSANSKGLTT